MSDLSTNGSFAAVKKIMSDNGPKNVPFIRSGNCGDTFINLNDLEYISEASHKQLPKSTTALYDVMMARKGKIGGASIITKNEVGYNCSENVIKLTIKNKKELNPFYFTSYFNSKYGIKQIERLSTGNVQPWVSIFQIRKLLIPILDIDFQKEIEAIVQFAFNKTNESKSTYTQAEQVLLQELNLADFQPSQEPVNVKSFSESFGSSGRLDAEYYQVKYDELEEQIKSSSFVLIKNIRTDNFRGLQPQYVEDGELNVINSKHILEQTLDYDNFEKTSPDYWDEQERARVFKNDILTYTTGANIGRTQVYLIDKKALASNHVNILRLKKGYNPQYIGFVMNSTIGRLQTEKLSAGSAQAELYPKDIDNFLIPIIEQDKQQQIADLVEQSFTLKKQSEHLLEVAKTAVEIAIEHDEETALAYIQQETKTHG
ncbi:restriction endonuclease subunit S [Roseivirga seohaensis]|nr:restriction endonuclease subunit S [Roseivirga seohaensis]